MSLLMQVIKAAKEQTSSLEMLKFLVLGHA